MITGAIHTHVEVEESSEILDVKFTATELENARVEFPELEPHTGDGRLTHDEYMTTVKMMKRHKVTDRPRRHPLRGVETVTTNPEPRL